MKFNLLPQLIMLTKWTIRGLLVNCLILQLLWASEITAQAIQSIREVKISLNAEQTDLRDLFNMIEAQTNFTFSYNRNDLDSKLKLNHFYRQTSVADILLDVARVTGLKFKQVNSNIHISKSPNTSEQSIEIIIQTRSVSGKINSYEEDEGLPGVNVVEKGTSNGTVTDINGNYTINVSENATLVFSSVGFTSEEVAVGNQSVINLTMTQDVKSLSEVVVIGYGQLQKRDVTGAVSSVNTDEINSVPVLGLDQAIQGRAAGVYVSNTQANPGGDVQIRIRGVNSIQGNNDPLYIIDGVVGGNINTVAPTDIESIDILKDASSTSIYGARGANGVVIVTTKSGNTGSNTVSFDSYYGFQNIINKLDLMNAREHAGFVNQLDQALGNDLSYPDLNNLQHDTDWQEELFRTAPMQNYNISTSGGREELSYYISGTYINQQGIVRNTEFNRYTLRLNLDSKISDRLKVGTRVGFSRPFRTLQMGEDYKGGSDTHHPVIGALELAPSLSPYDENGELVAELINSDGAQESNPIHHMENNIAHRYNTIINGNAFAEINLTEELMFKSSFGINFDNTKVNQYKPSTVFEPNDGYRSIANINTGIFTGWLSENYFTYNKSFSGSNLEVLAGYTAQASNFEGLNVRATDFAVDDFEYHNVSAGNNETDQMGSSMSRTAQSSFYSRLHYVLNDKYLFTINGRYDGSSKFGEDYRWGFFPSGAIAWRLSDEPFLQDLNLFSDLKLRASFGVSGSEALGAYQSLSAVSPVQAYIVNGTIVNGFRPTRLPNPNLRWEQTSQLNIGLDAGILGGRLNFNLDYYEKKTEDLFLDKPVPQTSGVSFIRENIGSLKNHGFELGLDAVIIDSEFKWSTGFNMSNQQSEVLKLVGEDQEIIGGSIGGGLKLGNMSILKVGEPIGSFFGYETEGLWQNDDPELNSMLQFGGEVEAGDIKFVDQNGDNDINDADRKIIGNSLPSFFGGFNNNFSYKGFDASLFLQFSAGNNVLNAVKRQTTSVRNEQNKLQELTNNTWTPENPDAAYPRIGYLEPGLVTDRLLEDGSFLRLREITLGYSLPTSLIERINVNRLRFYVTGTNLLTFTKYSGYDPEVNMYGGDSVFYLNTDVGSYPRAKSVFFGLNLTF